MPAMETIILNELSIRLIAFVTVFGVMAVWETWYPRRRHRAISRPRRWVHNLALFGLNSLLLRLIFPAAAVGFAAFFQRQGWGLFNYLSWPMIVEVAIAVVVLDLCIWLQHVMFHAVPFFWRFHRVHHADLDFDVTTGLRFHPAEIVISMLIKWVAMAALGPAVVAVVVFEVVLNAASIFNHSNARLPSRADRLIRLLLVTPDMHRVHHSIEQHETNSNFGFCLPWWDRLLGTYRATPARGHARMVLGLDAIRDQRQCVTLPGVLLLPFKAGADSYALGRRNWAGSSAGGDHHQDR